MIYLAISYEVFSETSLFRQDKKIFEVPSSVANKENNDSGCLGSYTFGISSRTGIKSSFFAIALINLSSSLNI